MTGTGIRLPDEGGVRRPFVAVVCSVPILCEAVADVLDSIADVRQFPAGRADTSGLLRALSPDAVVVDSEAEAAAAAVFARRSGSPVVRVALRQRKLHVFEDGAWIEPEADGASPETIRNVLVGAIYRGALRR